MPLEKYREKRNFKKTPEPSGSSHGCPNVARRKPSASSASRSTSPAICTTTFDSSTTVCCFRGPFRKGRRSIRPSRRLAMHVEDHPIEYGDFEGVIPEGYGAGIVMLWDRGTWTPESRRHRCRAEEGRSEIHARRREAEGIVGARQDAWAARYLRPKLAAHQASRRLGRPDRHRRVRPAQRQERRRFGGHPRAQIPRRFGRPIARRRAARPVRCFRRLSRRRRP